MVAPAYEKTSILNSICKFILEYNGNFSYSVAKSDFFVSCFQRHRSYVVRGLSLQKCTYFQSKYDSLNSIKWIKMCWKCIIGCFNDFHHTLVSQRGASSAIMKHLVLNCLLQSSKIALNS